MQSDGFKWKVTLDDGLVVDQVDKSGNKYAYEDLPHDRVRLFELWDQEQRILRVAFRPGEKLIWRRRTEMSPGMAVKEVAHIVGKIAGKVKGVIGVFESDGRIEMVPDFLPNSEWFYPPQFRDHERNI